MKKLTIMLSVYEAGDWIANRLDNLTHSAATADSEIWCVNANSPDPRDDEIPRKFPIQYVKLPERVGVYAAWNHIIKNSSSKYITNANADDIVAPSCYSTLMSALDRDHGVGFSYPSWYTTSVPNQQWHALHSYTADGGEPGNYHGDIEKAGVGHFPLWRRQLHDSHGLFDEEFRALGDADWWARCHYLGGIKFRWISDRLACYLWRDRANLWHRVTDHEPQEWARYHQKVAQYRSD